jgi:hypothetical protein
MASMHRQWTWVGPHRRHTVEFAHNTVTGVQRLIVDGQEEYKSGWKYRLTGAIYFVLDSQTVEIYVRAAGA